MGESNQANRTLVRVLIVLLVLLGISRSAWPNADKDRKNAVKNLAKEIEQAQFHKVYVPDFLDPSGGRTEKGCFFASTFSTNLAKDASNFEIVNRIQAQKKLNELHISAQDFQKPEVMSKAAQAVGADAFLIGTAAISAKEAKLSLSLRDAASDKEVRSSDYHEKLEPQFEGNFPAVEDTDSHILYFPGLDGVSQPKCKYCPSPDYTDEERRKRVSGSVMMSVSLDEKGTIRNVRVVTNPDEGLTRKAVNILQKWRMEPSYDPDGRAVPVRVMIETMFRLLG